MGKEKLIRPDAQQVKAMMETTTRIDAKLQEIVASEDAQRMAAQKAAENLLEDRISKELEQMDVEHINKGKQGIRVGLLRSGGVDNILQLSQMSYQEICSIDGVGEQSALKIRDTIKQIKENTKETVRVRLQTENPGQVDTDLVRALYIRMHTRPLRNRAEELYQSNHDAISRELPLAKKALNGFGWIFQSRSAKEQMIGAAESLENRLSGEFGDGKLIDAWTKTENPTAEACWEDFRGNASAYYAELEKLGLSWGKQDSVGGIPAQLAAEIEARSLDLRFLKATLRNYQTFGTNYIVHQKKVLLGDEMGLGKTVQAIAAMAALAAEGKTHFMVVCPASVLINWCREVQKFSTLEVSKVHGNDEKTLLHWRENGGVAVTTYESISRFTLPEAFQISMVIADEAHYVKNPETQRTKSLLKLLRKTEHALFMSGTPLENQVDEMCFLVKCLRPDVARSLGLVKFLSTAEQFRQQLAPVYLRRTRNDVLQELPELVDKEQWCDLGEVEKKAYRAAVRSGNFMAIRQVSWQVEDLKESSKAKRLLELCDQAKEQNRKVIVFSFFRSTLQKVTELLGDRCLEPITGAISPQRRQEIVDEFGKAEGGAVLVSQVQAGGTGLNIQSASVIIFCEPQIKPSIENQAISRAYRMGQVRDVLVYRLLADDTMDEKIVKILRDKQNQFDQFADESVVGTESLKPGAAAWISQMLEEERKRLEELPAEE